MREAESIGTHPVTNEQIFVKTGRFGPYVEMRPHEKPETADADKKKKKKIAKVAPRRASIPKEIDHTTLTVEQATRLLSIPRELGAHPDSGKQITAAAGRFGPFIVHDGDFRSLKGGDNPYDVTHERALEILKEPKKGRPGVTVVREVGEHPKTKKRIYLYKSKSGHFLKKGFKRISVPEEKAAALTPQEAALLLKG